MIEPNAAVPEGIPTGPHLCPLLLFHSSEEKYTLFNLLPLSAALNAKQLLVLSAVPFHTFRFFGPAYQEHGMTYPLDLWFMRGNESLDQGPSFRARPVVVWSEQSNLVEIVKGLLSKGAACVLAIIDSAEPSPDLAMLATGSARVRWVSVFEPTGRFHPQSPALIWAAFLQQIQALVATTGPDVEGPGNPMSPEFKTPVSLTRHIQAINNGSSSPWTERLDATVVPWDFVAAPNAIILNLLTFKLSPWGGEAMEPAEAHATSLQHARMLLAARGLTNYLMIAADGTGRYERGGLRAFMLKKIPRRFRPRLAAALSAGPKEEDIIREYSALFAEVPHEAAKLAPHQVILICPSATLAMERAQANFAREGLRVEDHAINGEAAYLAEVRKAVSGPGRKVQIPAPVNETQKRIMQSLSGHVSSEAQFFSAIAVMYATRFGCPVLKLTRTGSEVFDPFLEVHDEFLKADSDYTRAQAAISTLSHHTAALFPPDYLEFITSQPRALVHSFGDFPLEFTKAGHDYLGFRTEISRTPLTPGHLSIVNYNMTEYTMPLPTRLSECVIATPFPDGDEVREGMKIMFKESGTEVETVVVTNKEQLKAKLVDRNIRCLIYIGHGYHNPRFDINGLELEDGIFTAKDLRGLERLPPLVVLVGCSTAPSVSVFGGMHQAFLQGGTSLMVGTSFQVPKAVGVQFLTTFVEYLVGKRRPYPRDVVELVTVVRHDIRMDSVLLSLAELGKVPWDDIDIIAEEHRRRVRLLPPRAGGGGHHVALRELARILAERKIIPHASTPPYEWGDIPYPLFFCVVGFPWTFRHRNWGKTG